MKTEAGKLETYYIDRITGTAHKVLCLGKNRQILCLGKNRQILCVGKNKRIKATVLIK